MGNEEKFDFPDPRVPGRKTLRVQNEDQLGRVCQRKVKTALQSILTLLEAGKADEAIAVIKLIING